MNLVQITLCILFFGTNLLWVDVQLITSLSVICFIVSAPFVSPLPIFLPFPSSICSDCCCCCCRCFLCFFWGVFGGLFFFRFSIYFYYFFYFVLILYFFFVAFILFLYFIYTSGLIQPSFQFQGSKCAITQGIQKVSLLEEDDRCFPSRCGTGVFVCSRVLDIMLAFQDDAGFTVHVFPIHS